MRKSVYHHGDLKNALLDAADALLLREGLQGFTMRACARLAKGLEAHGAEMLPLIVGALEDLGYTCWPLVVGADDVGAPHRRKRVWIVAADTERLQLRVEQQRLPGRQGRRRRGQ